nr:hypothetical protein BgiMline_016869 [Biomphalaria glabrata]
MLSQRLVQDGGHVTSESPVTIVTCRMTSAQLVMVPGHRLLGARWEEMMKTRSPKMAEIVTAVLREGAM